MSGHKRLLLTAEWREGGDCGRSVRRDWDLEEDTMKQQQTAADIQQLFVVKEEFPAGQQDWCPSLDPPDLQIKEEQEKLWTCQVGEQRLEDFPISPVHVKTEDDEGQRLCGATEPPYSSLTQHIKREFDGEDCGEPELHMQDTIKTSHSSESETEDSDGDWEEFKDSQSDLNALSSNVIPANNLGGDSAKKSHSCSDCGERFAQKGTMQRHKRRHTGEKPFSCTICGKKMTRYHHLIGHMRCHSGEKPFSCSVCNKKFRWSGDVASHMRIHTGEKPHICSLCGRRFTQRSSLFTHSKSHNEERPLSCLVCNRRFHLKTTLVNHMRTHTGEKPYSCTVCGKGFSQVGALNRHIRIHTGEKPYSCRVCGKSFRQQTHVTNHKCVAQSQSSSKDCS